MDSVVLLHRLQLSLNLRDSPGFLATVPRPGRLYYNCIIGPGRGPDTSINTVVVVQIVTYLWQNEQAACGSALQTLVFAVATLHYRRSTRLANSCFRKYILAIVVNKFNHIGCGMGGVLINDGRI